MLEISFPDRAHILVVATCKVICACRYCIVGNVGRNYIRQIIWKTLKIEIDRY